MFSKTFSIFFSGILPRFPRSDWVSQLYHNIVSCELSSEPILVRIPSERVPRGNEKRTACSIRQDVLWVSECKSGDRESTGPNESKFDNALTGKCDNDPQSNGESINKIPEN